MQVVRSVLIVVVAVWGVIRLSGDVQAQLLGGLRAGSHTMTVGERERTYRLFVPPRAKEPIPLVLVLHGGGGDGRQIERHSGFNALARTEGFAVCYPDAFEGNWNDGRGVEFMTSHQQQIDDVAFIRKLVDEIARKQQIDRSRLFVVGISNGGFMTHRLVNDASDLFCAAGVIVGGIPKPIAKDFRPKHPVSVLMMQGEADPLVPYHGGFVAGNSLRPRGEIISTADTVALYLKAYNITGSPTITDVADTDPNDGTTTKITSYADPKGEVRVQLYTIKNGGHTWPGTTPYAPETLIGKTSQDFQATKTLWTFFRACAPRK
ncbi:MAG: PHB depolymerase family esterase [Planctomycetaceae bacterium]